jgi:hypothetical protein
MRTRSRIRINEPRQQLFPFLTHSTGVFLGLGRPIANGRESRIERHIIDGLHTSIPTQMRRQEKKEKKTKVFPQEALTEALVGSNSQRNCNSESAAPQRLFKSVKV